MRKQWIILAGLLSACSSEAPDPAADQAGTTASTPAPNAAPAKSPQKFKLDLNELKKNAEEVALVPSPAEMQLTLKNSGLQSKMAEMVKNDKNISMDVENPDQIAVRTGVVMADLVLTVKTSSKELKLDRLERLKIGFAKLGAGQDISDTIVELTNQIKNDAVNNDDLLKEMDELSGVMVPELEYEAGDWVVPLIQAGSWLEGSYIVSGAIIAEKKYDTASKLLRQPAVADYFLKYVQREGQNKAPDLVVKQLERTLLTLKEIANKDVLTEEDVKTINAVTGDVLKLL